MFLLGVLGWSVKHVVPPHVEMEEVLVEVSDLLGDLLKFLEEEVRQIVDVVELLPERFVVLQLGGHHEVDAAAVELVVALLHVADDLGGNAFPEKRTPSLDVLEDDLIRADWRVVVLVVLVMVVVVVVAVLAGMDVGGVGAVAGVEDALTTLVEDGGEVEGAVHEALRRVHAVPVHDLGSLGAVAVGGWGGEVPHDIGDLELSHEDEVGMGEGQVRLSHDANDDPEGEDESDEEEGLEHLAEGLAAFAHSRASCS
mmetsp:Transcript_19213/g.53391  ORF Transcript_19213/g.53391 Transcript_19213/m.53391 type:complete len:255 (+) Transcript_19213:371-1135(+)